MTDEEWTVGKTASVHSSTLGALSRGEIGKAEKKSRAPRKKAPEVNYRQLNELLWSTVLELAEGDRSRIEIIDELSATVHNNSNWREAQ